MNSEQLRRVYAKEAIKYDQSGDRQMWVSALFCSRIVGKYEKGATLGLADDMSRSVDTVENRAHAYTIFETLCVIENGKFRLFVFHCRRAPYIKLSHFRALYDLQNTFKLTDFQVLDLLNDIFQHEGSLSSRNLEAHVRGKYGDSRDWTFYAGKTQKELSKLLSQPDLPKEGREIAEKLFSFLGDNG